MFGAQCLHTSTTPSRGRERRGQRQRGETLQHHSTNPQVFFLQAETMGSNLGPSICQHVHSARPAISQPSACQSYCWVNLRAISKKNELVCVSVILPLTVPHHFSLYTMHLIFTMKTDTGWGVSSI